jgi:hypothetical protein
MDREIAIELIGACLVALLHIVVVYWLIMSDYAGHERPAAAYEVRTK